LHVVSLIILDVSDYIRRLWLY